MCLIVIKTNEKFSVEKDANIHINGMENKLFKKDMRKHGQKFKVKGKKSHKIKFQTDNILSLLNKFLTCFFHSKSKFYLE